MTATANIPDRRRMRHWKQRYDYNAEFVITKKLRWGDDPNKPHLLPGDPVTPEIKAKLGATRLKRWWEAKVIARADFDEENPAAQVCNVDLITEVENSGAGWYTIRVLEDEGRYRLRGATRLGRLKRINDEAELREKLDSEATFIEPENGDEALDT